MIKRLLNRFVALFFSSLISIQCFASLDVPIDGVVYTYNKTYAFVSYVEKDITGDIILKDEITFKDVTEFENGVYVKKEKTVPVTVIDSRVFQDRKKITSITANGIIRVGEHAFSGCTSLRRVKLGDKLVEIMTNAFFGCTALEYINLPAGLTTIGGSCFKGCESLFSASTLKIPSSVTSVGEKAFHGSGVKEVDWASQVAVPQYAFYDCKNLASINLHRTCGIGYSAFHDCTSLESIAIPQSCTTIENFAFYECSALTSVTLHKFLNIIGRCAFSNTGITNLKIPEGCENLIIGESAFASCSELKNIAFLDSKKIVIQSYAFSEIVKLEYLHLGKGITEIEPNNFNDCSLLRNLELPNTIERIGGTVVDSSGNVYYYGCFKRCPLLTKVDLPVNVEGKMINLYDSFNRCDGLENVTVAPEQVYNYYSSFRECPKLNGVVKRKTNANSVISRTQRANEVSIVGAGSFSDCPELERFECEFTVEGNAFYSCPKLKFDSYHIKYTETVPSYAAPVCYVRNVTMPSSVREIESNGVPYAGTVTIPDSLRIIHEYAINALEMSEIVLPDSLHTVYRECIIGGKKVLNKLTLKSKTPPVFLKDDGTPYTIDEINNSYAYIVRYANYYISLYVPKGTAEAYRNAPGWHSFKEIIEYGESSAIDDVAISAPTVTVEGGRIVVAGSVPVTIFNMSGTMIYSGSSDRIPALPKGLYIVNASGSATKVSI